MAVEFMKEKLAKKDDAAKEERKDPVEFTPRKLGSTNEGNLGMFDMISSGRFNYK